MNLPTQAEPIQRTMPTEKHADVDGIEPQLQCFCMQGVTNENHKTWHCLIGRNIWDTLEECP